MHKICLIIGLFVLMLSSCRAHRQVVQQITHDSASVSFREVEKVIHIPGDTIKTTMQVQVKKDGGDTGDGGDFVPQSQIVESKNGKVHIDFTKSGEIKVEAVVKDRVEKVTVLEKTIEKSKSEVTVVQEKENWFKKAIGSVWGSAKTVLVVLLIVAVVATAIKLGLNPLSILKNLFKKS